ncbi:MAG TPA: ABC transporter substrate-binding protein [Methylomirabilota bacterium]|nr:ABC transporter substrate-binding protein [Methylomirabilota bacterium]
MATLIVMMVLVATSACRSEVEQSSTAPPQTAISGTIGLHPSLKNPPHEAPLLMVLASKSPDPNQPPIIVKRVPDATFPYRYQLTAENITLVGSTFEGEIYVTARIDPTGTVGASGPGTLEGTYPRNPVIVGAVDVDITIGAPTPSAAPRTAPNRDRIPRIGLLWAGQTPFDTWSVPEALREGFRELGYGEGQIAFEPRYAESRQERLPELAAELVRLGVDVILAAGDPTALQAAQSVTKTVPIVTMAFADAAQLGFVASLARPGGNVTGLSFPFAELVGKQLEILVASVPGASRIGVLWNPDNPAHAPVLTRLHVAAQAQGTVLQPLEVRGPGDFEDAFSAMRADGASALVAIWDPMLYAHSGWLTRLALGSRLPASSTFTEFVAAGGLIAYGPNTHDMFRGAASYVDRILKGARPADLPMEQPTKFELVINLTTAKALGLDIPQSVLMRADRVIHQGWR